MEKHIIFLYPLHPVLQELKDLLEQDGGYDINEIDDANEYRQLVGVIGQCITFTSDVRKIHSTIDAQAQLVKNGISKVVIMGKIQNFPQEVGQLRVLGIQEILPEMTPLKSIQFKLNLFLKSFEAVEIQRVKDLAKEEKKSKLNEAKKVASLIVDNEKETPAPFDFKGLVKNAITPFTVKPIDEKKKKKFFKPLFENQNQNYTPKQFPKSSGKIEFDEVSEKKSTPLRLSKEEEKRLKKLELEEAAALIKKGREALKLDGDQSPKRKKYRPFRVGEDDVKKKHTSLRLIAEGSLLKRAEDENEKKKSENKMTLLKAKDLGEQTIDYSVFEEEKEEKRSYLKAENSPSKEEEKVQEEFVLNYPEFFWPPEGVSTFLPLLLELLQTRPFDQDKFMKFLCFIFHKKLHGHLTYIVEREDQVELLSSSFLVADPKWDWKSVYSEKSLVALKTKIIPSWSDETFQSEKMEFVFPFYFNKERMGVAHALFDKGAISNQEQALEAELLIVMARTVYLKEYGF